MATLMVDLGELRSLLVAQSIPSISKPMLMILVSWLVVIFFGFSLIAPPNATTTLALVASAFSVACAIFLILELDHPFGGLIHIPSEPIINVLSSFGEVSRVESTRIAQRLTLACFLNSARHLQSALDICAADPDADLRRTKFELYFFNRASEILR